MGGLLSFELARHLRRQYDLTPARLLISAFRAAQIPDPDAPTYHLPEAEFLASLRRLNGTPESILQNEEMMQLILPVLRADVELCETYNYVDEAPLQCPVTAFGGEEDRIVTREELAAWGRQTYRDFELLMFAGDHFFINSARASLLRAVSERLERALRLT